uniref:TOG domain-containing protein n=1 Tax=Biomphalaria glabrata TaxID=6526 RepID=A0A2C9KR44_BIOGL
MTSAQDENALVERVFLRIGSAETDEQLQTALGKFLAPLLLKLNSPDEAVRSKVLKLLAHIKTRLKSRNQIKLPLDALLTQFQDPTATPFITNFTILFIKIGYPRVEPDKQAELVPLLINCLDGRSQNHQDSLLQLLLPALRHLKMPKTEAECRSKFQLADKPGVKQLVLDYFMDVLLLTYNSHVTSAPASADGSELPSQPPNVPPPPGLSQTSFKRLIGETPMVPEELEKAKLSIITFLASGVLTESETVCHFVVASSDTRHSVATSADMELKKITGSVDWNSKEILSKLFSLFQGTVIVNGQPLIKPEDRRSAVSPRIRLKIFPLLLKAREATNMFPACLQIVFDCLFGVNPNAKLRVMAVEFVHHICLNCEESKFAMFDVILLNGLLKLINESKEDAKLRSLAYVAVGKIGRRSPNKISKDLQVVQLFFDALCQEDGETRMAVQEALSLMAEAFRSLDDTNQRLMEALLLQNIDKEDIKSECKKALRNTQIPTLSSKQSDEQKLPDFVEMMRYIVDKKYQCHPDTYFCQVLLYLRMCLSQLAGIAVDWNLENLPDQVPSLLATVKSLLEKYPGDDGPIQQYVRMLIELLVVSTNSEPMYCLLEMVAMVPTVLAPKLSHNLDWIKSLLSSSKDDIKQYAAELYAIACWYTKSPTDFCSDIKTFLGNLTDKNSELVLGSLLALGYCIGLKMKVLRSGGNGSTVHDQLLLTQCVQTIASLLDDSNVSKKSTACLALSEIGRNGPLPLPPGIPEGNINGTDPVNTEERKTASTSEDITKLYLVNKLVGRIKTSNEQNKSKQIELQFNIGQALVDMAMGASSPRARCIWTTSKEEHQKNVVNINDDVPWFLNELLSTYICHSNPHLRQGACVWLLTLIRQAGHHKALQSSLLDIQRAFMRMLSENDEITQDLASKGLGQVMEVCTPEQKNVLVSELVETLMTGKSSAKTEVSADTTVFQSGLLGKAPDGSGLSTYKELCAIATDLNQPDLIYKFMHLANHNATWNTRKGAAFGFSTIAAQAGEQLAPFMDKIVPKLYRYQFDPNPKIQQAMSSIWNALVQDNKKTVDIYLKKILDDLISNLTSNQWRIRESSCLAVSDLLRGRVLDDIIEDIPQLWEICLKVRDDIKESVRLAADSACKTLSKVSIKVCDVTNGKVGEKATKLILPCLLQCSLHSTVSEVRAIGLSTILQISRNAGALLKPSISVLVPALLEAVSGLEPSVMNYLSLHTGTQANQDKLDSARIAASKMSPMMETINRCVQYVDNTILEELIPRLIEIVKGGIGVSTKAGCSSFVVSLVHQCPQDLSPYTGKLLAAFLHGLNDRNAVVRKSYATAIGYLVKVSKDSSVERLIEKLKVWYLESEGSQARHGCSVTLHAISEYSPDTLRRHANLAMPLAFFAMHEEVKKDDGKKSEDSSDWSDVWNEITPGTEAGIRLYLPEIVALLSSSIQSQAWSVKAQSARAMATVAQKLGNQLESPHLDQIVLALVEGLSGRTWEGKESLLNALSVVCTSCRQEILKSSSTSSTSLSLEQILTVILRECGKENPAYKMAAMKCLGPILELYQLDHFKAVWEMTQSIVGQSSSGNKPDDDEDSSLSQKQEILSCAFTLLGEAWPSNPSTQASYIDVFVQLLCESMPISTWKIQMIILKDLQKLLQRLAILQKENVVSNAGNVKNLVQKLLITSLADLNNIKYLSLRTSYIDVFVQLLCESMPISTWKIQMIILKDLQKLVQRLAILQKENVVSNAANVKNLVQKLLITSLADLNNIKYLSLRTESLSLIESIISALAACDQLRLIDETLLSRLKDEITPIAETGPWELRDRAKILLLTVSPITANIEAMEH